jgi:hypothetical protein
MVGGAVIGTTALGVSVMGRGGWRATVTVSVIGYVIMASGIMRTIQQRRRTSKIA